jgi:hypothetical protein
MEKVSKKTNHRIYLSPSKDVVYETNVVMKSETLIFHIAGNFYRVLFPLTASMASIPSEWETV